MDLVQLQKRIEWLDDERRKDKDKIALLEERLNQSQAELTHIAKSSREQNDIVARLSTSVNKIGRFDESLIQLRSELNDFIKDLENRRNVKERESEKLRQVEFQGLHRTIAEVRKELEKIQSLEESLNTRKENEDNIQHAVDSIRLDVEDNKRNKEEINREIQLLNAAKILDTHKVQEIQNEINGLRKRINDQFGKLDQLSELLQKVQGRISELLASEVARRDQQSGFLENQRLLQAERDRTWSEWEKRFISVEILKTKIDEEIKDIDKTRSVIKKTTDSLAEVTIRFERRINEITEIQRINEEQSRQGWVNFKADDRKRWTAYTISLDEEHKELHNQIETLQKNTKELKGKQQQIDKYTQDMVALLTNQLHAINSLTQEWITEFQRFQSSV